MKILVLGSGGREHALIWKIAQSPLVTRLWCAPGNAGTDSERLASNSALVTNVPIPVEDLDGLLEFARKQSPDFTVVGPDNPLALGVVDRFQAAGLLIWGPNQRAARFESSKAFSQDFMSRHNIPTARSETFTDVGLAKRFAHALSGCCAVKADGLAMGKGVLLTTSIEAAEQAIVQIMVRKSFGPAGERIVIQELLEGVEISLHALCDGRTARLFPTSRDHKRALDGDAGLNTGGMGAYSPTPFLTDVQLETVGRQILTPWLRGCQTEGIDYRGILYPGIMLTKTGPKVIEFNARFGDPEAQVYLTRLKGDLVELLLASAQGRLDQTALHWIPDASVCVVMASGGYPGNHTKGIPLHGLDEAARLPCTKVFHAGTSHQQGSVVTNGGRVLGVTAWGPSVRAAQTRAYAAVDLIQFEGAHWRRDIAVHGFGPV